MPIPHDYAERVYAGVLGKLLGVYLGRPFEGWTYERIMSELGEITYYVHQRRGVPLIVTDDDISGTFTFLRALPDYGNRRSLTPAQIGQTWLNYIIEQRSILWWGGMGNSTEHTAFLRLKHGIPAPESGSMARNGKVVAEQIGAQIFIDGWAMVAPGDPELAADLARRAASVSHDGEAIYGAQVLAAMEAQAFVESGINVLLDTGLRAIPDDSVIARLIHDIRDWHSAEPDWRKTRERIAETYGYDKYGGNCHMVPNHALIVLGLLYGNGDFDESLKIVNTAGWDTDCNSGNLGCLLGIRGGLAALETGRDWRGPVADRLYLSTADGGRAITDAARETFHIVNSGRALMGQPPITPKQGARFHFELPGSVQGFQAEQDSALTLENVAGHSALGERSLALRYRLAPEQHARTATPTFIPEAISMPGYTLMAAPTLYAGQTVRAALSADGNNGAPVAGRLYLRVYGENDRLSTINGPEAILTPDAVIPLNWQVPDTGGAPIAAIGVELASAVAAEGSVYLDYLTWDGAPDVLLTRPPYEASMWRRAWIDGVDQFEQRWPEPFRIVQNEGRGLLSTGTAEWMDYRVTATVTPFLASLAGVGARVQGLCRYYALVLREGGMVQVIKALDGDVVLAETSLPWQLNRTYTLSLQVVGNRIQAWIDDAHLFDIEDTDRPLSAGGVALICEEGCLASDGVAVHAAS